jgi:hypothetical protein
LHFRGFRNAISSGLRKTYPTQPEKAPLNARQAIICQMCVEKPKRVPEMARPARQMIITGRRPHLSLTSVQKKRRVTHSTKEYDDSMIPE